MKNISNIPEQSGLSARSLLNFVERIEQMKLEVNHFVLMKDGITAAEFYRAPYRKDCPQMLYSLSKSFTSIAVGIAWDQGDLDLQDPVISFFPDKLPERVSTNLAKMTVHHLLSMNAGHDGDIYPAVARERDWVRAFLAQEVQHEPGSHYRYSTHATYMLSAIIERVTGESLVDFLMPRLFEPLGIPRPTWETCPLGITAGGMGLSLTTCDVAKFGQMLLAGGIYEGKRIVSERYVNLATTEQSDNRAGATRIDWAQGYGYQFHICRRGCYRGDGSFGQLCFVAPREQIVIAANCSFKSMSRLQELLDLVYECILDRLGQEGPESREDTNRLQEQLSRMSCFTPVTRPVQEGIPDLQGCRYRMNDNPQGIDTIGFESEDSRWFLQLGFGGEGVRDRRIPFDCTKPVRSHDTFPKDLSVHLQEVVTHAAWLDERTLQLAMFYIETPYVATYIIRFEGDRLDVEFRMNVSLHMAYYRAAGRRE